MLGKVLGGRYQIVSHLGGGGFGQTYLAEDFHLPGNPRCVVKQLKPKVTSPEALHAARRLFDTEAQVLYNLGNHDQIPRLFAHFEENQEFYLVQEFVEGEVLSQELRSRGAIPEAELIGLLQDILTVLEFVHDQQVVHRDIKPSNLIRRSSDRRPVLIDFGAVKQIGVPTEAANPHATVTIAVGSSGYMPNEQLAGKPRFSSDIYALGMLTLQCLTGVYPKKLQEDPRTSEILWRDRVQVSPELAEILDQMVRYDHRQRYPSATAALADLRKMTAVSSVSMLLTESRPVSDDGHLVWLERGDELFQQQRYREALNAYDRVIQATDDSVAWFKRGMTLEHLNNYTDAAASYDRVVQLQPDDYLAWYKQGSALQQLQQYSEALRSFDRVIELQPENYWAWHDRGQVLEQLQQPDVAIQSYDRAVQLKPDFSLAVESRKRVLSQLKQVNTLYHLQHYDEAVASCDRAIEQNPDDSLSWLMRGMALENLQRYEAAVFAYDRVVEIQPDDHVAWFKRGNSLEKLQRYDEALVSYAKVVQLQPDNAWAWHDRGRLLEQLNFCEEAIAAYDRAVQLKSGFAAAEEGRKRMLHQRQSQPTEATDGEDITIVSSGLNRLERGLADSVPRDSSAHGSPDGETVVSYPHSVLNRVDETIIGVPAAVKYPEESAIAEDVTGITDSTSITGNAAARLNQSDRWLQQGRDLEKQQRYADAIVAYQQASQLRADDPTLWYRQGRLHSALGCYEAAIVAYRRALQIQPNSADLWCCLGMALLKLRRYQEAAACFGRAVKLKPGKPDSWYWHGRALCELKQYQQAVQSFDRAIQLKPDFQSAIADRQRLLELNTGSPTLKPV